MNGTTRDAGRGEVRSEDFVDTTQNRDSLVPVPARPPGEDCVHRAVLSSGAGGERFSAERGHPVFPVRVPASTLSMSIGELAPGAETSNHRHAYESLMYVLAGEGHSVMEGKRYDWKAGDALYTPAWCWHKHVAAPNAKVQYVTATNMPLLRRLGQTVLREESR